MRGFAYKLWGWGLAAVLGVGFFAAVGIAGLAQGTNKGSTSQAATGVGAGVAPAANAGGSSGAGTTAGAGTADLVGDRELLTPLDGLWRFRLGDDAGYARADFDDSSWALIHADRRWSDEGYSKLSGYMWYRLKLSVAEVQGVGDGEPLAVFVPQIITNFQLFIDGRLVGGCEGMQPVPKPTYCHAMTFPVPKAEGRGAHIYSIALRVWQWPAWASYNAGGPGSALYVGSAKRIAEMWVNQRARAKQRYASDIFVGAVEAIAMLAAGVLFIVSRKDREYLWFAMVMAAQALDNLHTLWFRVYFPRPMLFADFLGSAISNYRILASIGLFYTIFHERRTRWFYVAVGAVFVKIVVDFGVGTVVDFGFLGVGGTNLIAGVLLAIANFWIVQLIVRRLFSGEPIAKFLLIPVVVAYGDRLISGVLQISYQLGLQRRFATTSIAIISEPFTVDSGQVAELMFLLAMMAILLYRFAHSRREQQRLSTEFDAARTVQQVLIPEEIPAVAGFEIHSIYRPYGELGGDFFQILPQDDGSVLIVIGDVSGKGLPAAMTVSLLVGTVRTLAHYTQSPGAILAAMNERMIGRNNGGFTTCLVLHVDTRGRMTAANAGHISPYIGGREIELENGLPLGIAEGAAYAERVVELPEDVQLTLLTDGVVEARNHAGELFGFERSLAVSGASSEAIAEAALRFGQDDDITVLTLRRGAAERASIVVESPVMA